MSRFRSSFSPRDIFAAARRFVSGSMLSKLTGVAREVTLAITFGTSADLASFMVAFRLAQFFRRFIGESGLGSAFIPYFERVKRESPGSAAHTFAGLSLSLKLLLFALSSALGLLFHFAAPHLPGVWGQISQLAAWLSGSLFFVGLYALNQSFLQTCGRFFIGSIAPAAFNLCFCAGALLAFRQTYAPPLVFLSWMVVLGFAAQWLVTCPSVSRCAESLGSDRVESAAQSHAPLARMTLLSMIGLGAQQINNLVDGIFAKIADPSAPAYLWYALRFYQLPLSLVSVSLSAALLPALAAKKGDFAPTLHATVARALHMLIPATALMILLAPSATTLLYGYGPFGLKSVMETSRCLWAYSGGLIGSCLTMLYAQGFYAKGDYKTPMYAALIATAFNCALNALFVFYFELGGVSIALATATAAWVSALWLRARLSLKDENSASLVPLLCATLIAAGVVMLWSVGKKDFSSRVMLGLIDGLGLPGTYMNIKALVYKTSGFLAIYLALYRIMGRLFKRELGV